MGVGDFIMAKVLGIDLGTTNSCMAVVEGGEPGGCAERGRRTDDAVGRGVHEVGRARRGAGGQTAGGRQSEEYGLFHQAVHGAQVRRDRAGTQTDAV